MSTEKHYGNLVEEAVRKRKYSIAELSRLMNVQRRTIYNWFLEPDLKPDVIYRIGMVISHDFSVEMPEYFDADSFKSQNIISELIRKNNELQEKYNDALRRNSGILEKYNKLLDEKAQAKAKPKK